MELLGSRVKVQVTRRQGSAQSPESYFAKPQWLRGTVEAFRPRSGKHLVAIDVVYGRCVRGGVFGSFNGVAAKTKEHKQRAAHRKALVVCPCKVFEHGVVCTRWARAVWFAKCSCWQPCTAVAARKESAEEEDPEDVVSRSLTWAIWIDVKDAVAKGVVSVLPAQELVCVCRKCLVQENAPSYAGEKYRQCKRCERTFHQDCVPLREHAQEGEKWTCPFCEARRLVERHSDTKIKLPQCSLTENLSEWVFWREFSEGSDIINDEGYGEWVFSLTSLRHMIGADHDGFLHLELDAIAGVADKHRDDMLHGLVEELELEEEIRKGLGVDTARLHCGKMGIVRSLLNMSIENGSGQTKEEEAGANLASSVTEGDLERYMRTLALQELDQNSSAAKPWYAIEPSGTVAIHSPRGGYIETRDSHTQLEFSSFARVFASQADSQDAPGCISPSGRRHIRKWPGSNGTTDMTCARLRPRPTVDHEPITRLKIKGGRGSGPVTTMALYADTEKKQMGVRKRSRSRTPSNGSRPIPGGAASAQRRHLRDVAESFETVGKQLTLTREKRLRFGKSPIHAWGVFAEEPLAPNDFVIEYKGELIRPILSDLREKLYESQGIPDYMFRIDDETVCDATQKGSLARFINHSCDPNCYTNIISHLGSNKIVIYAKRAINPGEELSYDYKFPIETNPAEKIPCSCGAANCRRFMN